MYHLPVSDQCVSGGTVAGAKNVAKYITRKRISIDRK